MQIYNVGDIIVFNQTSDFFIDDKNKNLVGCVKELKDCDFLEVELPLLKINREIPQSYLRHIVISKDLLILFGFYKSNNNSFCLSNVEIFFDNILKFHTGNVGNRDTKSKVIQNISQLIEHVNSLNVEFHVNFQLLQEHLNTQ